ncbi:MAG: GNAT family N-acetyltransferase [Alphaproteobacteria bacterium]|nr:GNAT family N-acetyltransferase [Alphaproteobacteria bacterium]
MTLEIKPVPDDDLEAFHDLFNEEALARNAGTVPYPSTLEWARERLQTRRSGEAEGQLKDRGFFEDGRLVACAGYFFRGDELEIGYSVHRNERGRGLATKVARMVVQMVREDRHIGPIIANYFTDNPASGRVLEKLGFVKAGLGTGSSMAREGEIESQRMELRGDVCLASPVDADYPVLFAHQDDAEARWKAGAGRVYESVEHYKSFQEKAMENGAVRMTILHEGHVAGYIASFDRLGNREVSYWLGRDYWGKGIATRALEQFLQYLSLPEEGLYARVMKDHPASARVLEKAGFEPVGEDSFQSDIRGGVIEEYVYRYAK